MIAAIRDGLPTGVELDEREEAILDQDVINPSIAEVRQSRIAVGKLLAQLDLPDSTSETVRNARNAAQARWRKAS